MTATQTKRKTPATVENLSALAAVDTVADKVYLDAQTIFGKGWFQIVNVTPTKGGCNVRLAHPKGATFSICYGKNNLQNVQIVTEL